MILDLGPAIISRKTNTAPDGDMPVWEDVEYFRSWYGELSFETSPFRPTGIREETRCDARIRVLQNRRISNHDHVRLAENDGTVYEVARAYHGTDPDSGEPITDLSLVVITP